MIPRVPKNFRATFLQFLFIGFLPFVGVGQLPDFASKVQLHNAGGAEVKEDGQASTSIASRQKCGNNSASLINTAARPLAI